MAVLTGVRARWHLHVGRLLGKLGRHESAVERFRSATAATPENVTPYLFLGWSYGELKQHEQALSAFDQALLIAPDSAYAHAHEGLSWMHLGKYQEASDSLNRSFRIDSKYKDDPRYLEVP